MSRGRLPFLVVLASWGLFLAVQRGDPFDESEHCHVAWMMGRMHQQPLQDFFQNHQPLLWDLLKTYYVFGGDGPEVLYFGRGLVVVCALLFALGAWRLARNWARGDDGASVPGPTGGLLGVAPVLLMSLATFTALVIRPETVGLPLFTFALVCWTRPGGGWADVGRGALAGALFGAAVFASPRFVLLGGALVLLPRDRRQMFSLEAPPLLSAVAAAAVVVIGCQWLQTGRLSDIRLNMEFSSLFYKIGAGNFVDGPRLAIFAAGSLLASAWLFRRLDAPGRSRFLVQAAYLLLVTAASLSSAWPYLYAQNVFVPVVWLGVMFACAAGRLRASRIPAGREPVYAWAMAAAAVCLLIAFKDVWGKESILARVEQKRTVLAMLRPGEKVLLSAIFHPISAPDATYYGNVVVDAEDHMRKTVEMTRARRWELPECDYLHDVLARRPAVLDDYLLKVLPEGERKTLREVLDREYTVAPPCLGGHRCFRRNASRLSDASSKSPQVKDP